jgi:lipoate-protein ligase A
MNILHHATWHHIDTGPSDAFTNMALDEVFLHKLKFQDAVPVLRFYTWSPPAISVGYFQDVSRDLDLDLCRARGWSVVRRLTGGRSVFHDQELTYSIFLPRLFYQNIKSVRECYRYLSQGFLQGLRGLGVHAEMVTLQKIKGELRRSFARSPDCFASPSWYEISVDGKKIVGSAQRRMPYGVLQHGSILISTTRFQEFREVFSQSSDKEIRRGVRDFNPGMTSLTEILSREISLEEVKIAILQGFRQAHGIHFEKMLLSSHDKNAVRDLVRVRYGRSEWNLNRKPSVFKGQIGINHS